MIAKKARSSTKELPGLGLLDSSGRERKEADKAIREWEWPKEQQSLERRHKKRLRAQYL